MPRPRPLSHFATALLLIAATFTACADTPPVDDGSDWPHYARDLAATKYSPLEQISTANVAQLEVAWSWESADYRLSGEHEGASVNPNYQATPIKIGDRLYTSTNMGQAVALDPVTGEEIWRYDPYASGLRDVPGGRSNRGVAYWSDGTEERILLGSGEYLVSIDATTGLPDPDFGSAGAVNLADDPDPRVLTYSWTSAPLVVRDVVVVGTTAMVPNRNWTTAPPGYVRAYDMRTGELRWRFSPIPEPGDPAIETWADSSWVYSGNGNVWTLMSADEELGHVYLPLKTTTNDWYGGARPGDNLYGESVVAVDVDTGERVWHYQMVRHGLWDYDPPAAPNVMDVVIDGEPRKIVAQVTKQAFVFAFDRETGEPIWPIEDRPVPTSPVPGEIAAETQPFPTHPAPFDHQGITIDDLIDFTPELRAEAEEILDDFVYGPMYTPPTVRGVDGKQGTILMPGWVGGANWGGAAVDRETGLMYIPSVTSPNVTALVPPPLPDSSDHRYIRGLPREVPMPGGLPLLKPPYGRITAIDMNDGEHVWMQPNGPGPRDHPAIQDLELPWLGQRGRPAPLLTRTLLFIGEGTEDALSILPIAGGKAFRAWDKETGDVVWEMDLPAGTSGAPMTYMADGRQFIVVAVGDRDTRGRLIALALPEVGG
ncbi:MAG: PQQ-binding-like beta-propeller repeat protein [Gemmatimonadota bacterium]|nr:PQQ-binding-like beta-propeller repeat protein [Gemmatimonadota bacterium]MDE3004508.1 PQQ-binding-like beta-propeller repeat protein [Gemmatimonadota bacterium]MDE3012835.1 PQQ-binding-like beta-propeller repeat protein [Gemmatimonadota bacterium]